MNAAAGDPKAMRMMGLFYGEHNKLHLEMSYMWLSLSMENAAPKDKVFIRKHLDEYIIPKLRDFDIASAEKKIKWCKKSNYRDCADTSFKNF